MLLQRSWRWLTTLACEMLSSPDTLQVLLNGFTSMVWSMASKFTVLGQHDLAWLSRFLQLEQNFLNHLVTVLQSTAPSPFEQQMFLVASTVLWPSLNLLSISSRIRLHCTFICAAFKSHMEWSNAHVCIPTTMILPTIAGGLYCLNCFSHVMYM